MVVAVFPFFPFLACPLKNLFSLQERFWYWQPLSPRHLTDPSAYFPFSPLRVLSATASSLFTRHFCNNAFLPPLLVPYLFVSESGFLGT